MSIFVSVASYRDPELVPTLLNAIEMADNPDSIYFGVVCQELPRKKPDLSNIRNCSVIHMHAKYARGVGLARSKALELYNNEDYYLQIDSHMRFEKGWDTLCFEEYEKAKVAANHNKVLLSFYPGSYVIESNKTIILKNDEERFYPSKQIPVLRPNGDWSAKRVVFDFTDNLPEVSKTILAGFVFASADLIKDVPYDPEISFMGEELCFAMRAWTRGWDIYSPKQKIAYHFYTRPHYNKIWKDAGQSSWKSLEYFSKQRQKNVLCGIEQGTFGPGDIRSLSDFEDFVGFDFKREYGVK